LVTKPKWLVNQKNIARFVASFTRIALDRRQPKDQWCKLLDAVADRIVMLWGLDSEGFSFALDRLGGPRVQRIRLFRIELVDDKPAFDDLTVLADTGWLAPGDYEGLAKGLEEIVVVVANAKISERERKRRIVRWKEPPP
jgi:hypothetical protein